MNRIINFIANDLHKTMREPDGWGTWSLPGNYDMTFEFTNLCELEVRKLDPNHLGRCSVIRTVSFRLLEKGDWITIEIFQNELKKLFQDITFSEEEIEEWLLSFTS